MKISATELAHDSKAVIDRVITKREAVEIQRHGKTVAEIKPNVGVDRAEFLRIMKKVRWTKEESAELKKAIDAASDVIGYAGRD